MGGARRRPMAAGEEPRHANERGWRGNPGGGATPGGGARGRSGSGRSPTPEPCSASAAAPRGALGGSPASSFALFRASREERARAARTRPRRCLAVSVPPWPRRQSAGEREAAARLVARAAPGVLAVPPAAGGASSDKALSWPPSVIHDAVHLLLLGLCVQTRSRGAVRPPRGPDTDWVTDLPGVPLGRVRVTIRSHRGKRFAVFTAGASCARK